MTHGMPKQKAPAMRSPELFRSRPSFLVLLSGWRCASRKRPHAVRELEHQHSVVLTRAPHGAGPVIEVHLRGAPVGTAGLPLPYGKMIRAWACRRRAGRVVVSDFLRPPRIANVENPNAGVEESAC